MIILIIATILTLIVLVYFWLDSFSFGMGLAMATIFAMFAFPISIFIMEGIGTYFEQEKEVVAFTQLYALKDNTGTEGTFLLGSGRIGQELYYFYYTKTDDGGFIGNKVSADEVLIYEDANENNGYYLKIKSKFVDEKNYWWGTPEFNRYRDEIHVPPGTILPDFTLDLE